MHELQAMLAAPEPCRLLLQGAPGSGKSVALAATVEWARATGWWVPPLARVWCHVGAARAWGSGDCGGLVGAGFGSLRMLGWGSRK